MEASVEFKIGAPAGVGDDELERTAFEVLDTIETDLADVAIGPVMACDFAKAEIKLLFSVDGATESEIQAQIGQVVKAIEGTLGLDHPLSTTKVPAQSLEYDALPC